MSEIYDDHYIKAIDVMDMLKNLKIEFAIEPGAYYNTCDFYHPEIKINENTINLEMIPRDMI